ncbi:BppU family phage baseplate upper protein [Acetanaerobacterium elongatum]|uniref:BppU N-terminal domain-containing protein n=1 Tax=Acetanaerobacterium elongatum TaxID=258515 RepID=A0A1G9Z2W0_9FIRM|nr:BppU family phage baseplate upper protein [Acetanaerobacterium elongatum]SDN15684.1 protein of unknown function [Acetanaerobacterium elongatum]
MVNAVYNIDLSLKQSEILQTGIILTQGDNSSIVFHIRILDGGKEIDYSKATARIVFIKEDKTVVEKDNLENPPEGGYNHTLGTNELAVIGKVIGSVLLYGPNGERLSASRFVFQVQADMLAPGAVESSSEMDALSKAIQLLHQLEDEAYTGTAVFTLESETSTIEITTDTNGKPLDCRHAELVIKVPENLIANAGDQVYVMGQVNDAVAAGAYCSVWGGATADKWMLGWFKNLGSAIRLNFDVAGGAVCVTGDVVAGGISSSGSRNDVASGKTYGYTTQVNNFQAISKITLTAAYSRFPAGTVVVVRDIKK